jgi:transcriptional regulator with XRE-family HTH domain
MILGRQLQALREKAGLSYEQAAEAIYSSSYTVRRMERAEGGLKPLTVKSLLMAYGITDVREIDTFLGLARDASKPGWWHSYDDVLPSWFKVAVGLEESASLIRAYEPQVVPGLLQTEDYARAITTASFPGATEDETERRVALRLARQELLRRPAPPEYWVVLDETVLRRPVGGRDVMRSQLARLIEAAEPGNITIQVIPLRPGGIPRCTACSGCSGSPTRRCPTSSTARA